MNTKKEPSHRLCDRYTLTQPHSTSRSEKEEIRIKGGELPGKNSIDPRRIYEQHVSRWWDDEIRDSRNNVGCGERRKGSYGRRV